MGEIISPANPIARVTHHSLIVRLGRGRHGHLVLVAVAASGLDQYSEASEGFLLLVGDALEVLGGDRIQH